MLTLPPKHAGRLSIGLALAGILICYWPVFLGLGRHWATDEDMGHGFFVPVVIVWIVRRDRLRLASTPSEPSRWAFAFLAAGAVLQCAATLSAGLFVGSVAFLCTVVGAVVMIFGFGMLRAAAFPLLLALFMLPKLAIVYTRITLPLQLLATRIAETGLSAVGEQVTRHGNVLQMHGHAVAVVEACNGIRYVIPLALFALIYGYAVGARRWVRLSLWAAAVPVAILANGARVAAAAANPVLDSGMPHLVAGCVLFVACLAAIAGLHTLFQRPRKAAL